MSAPATKPKSSGVVIPFQPRWWERLAAFIIYVLLRSVTLTLRYRWVDRSGLKSGELKGASIYCLWHNRLALSMTAYFSFVKKHSGGIGLAAMASASRDGGLLIAVLERFGVKPARGSSSRRGPQALRELTTWSRRGYDLAITPDGPRGPCYALQDGIISLAQLTGKPIVPVGCNLQWKIRVKSWDRFQIPIPFSKCEMIFEAPVAVPREATIEEREAIRARLEATMRSISAD